MKFNFPAIEKGYGFNEYKGDVVLIKSKLNDGTPYFRIILRGRCLNAYKIENGDRIVIGYTTEESGFGYSRNLISFMNIKTGGKHKWGCYKAQGRGDGYELTIQSKHDVNALTEFLKGKDGAEYKLLKDQDSEAYFIDENELWDDAKARRYEFLGGR